MRVLLVNSVCGIGSTGRICTDLAQKFEKEGHEVKIAYGRDGNVPEQFRKYAVRIGSDLDVKLHGVRTRVLDEHGFGSKRATKQFLKWAEEYNPELLWIHNIHGYYLNVELLFEWIKSRPDMQVKWTLHDCWAFTGHCAYFTMAACEKWKTHCYGCAQKSSYPTSSLRDNCKRNFDRKRKAFIGVKNMTLIAPSKWLADLTKESYLKDYPVEVHYNTIDTSIFKPTLSDLRKKHNLEGKKVVLGVANVWDERKGLNDFLDLANILADNYMMILVGLSPEQINSLPENIIGLGRTSSPQELAALYTMSDVYVNPSKEETFGMTTLEACACGTKAIVYKGTACEEIITALGKGMIVDIGAENLKKAVIRLCEEES